MLTMFLSWYKEFIAPREKLRLHWMVMDMAGAVTPALEESVTWERTLRLVYIFQKAFRAAGPGGGDLDEVSGYRARDGG